MEVLNYKDREVVLLIKIYENITVVLGRDKLIFCLANNYENNHMRCVLFISKILMRTFFFVER